MFIVRSSASLANPSVNDPRKIIHVDMDAFYASVEQRDDPSLRGRPVAVGGARLRGVVAAASYEARQWGVRSAMPSVTAARLCPELVFVKPRFEVYKAVSQQIRAIFAEYTPLIEPLSLDEAYLDVTQNLKGMTSATEIAREVRARILEVTGLTASAGVSYNKFLAKIASDQNKPNGQFVIPPGRGEAFIETLPVSKFHGVGPATAGRLRALGIETGGDLRRQTPEFLQAKFGKSGAWYYDISRGVDHRRVKPDRVRKSVGSERTFFQDLSTLEEVEDGVRHVLGDVWRWCEKTSGSGRTVTVKVKYNDFHQVTRSRTLADAVDCRDTLEAVSLELARSVFPLTRPIRLLGVQLSSLCERPPPPAQLALGL